MKVVKIMPELKSYSFKINENNFKDILALTRFHKTDLTKISAKMISDFFNPMNETTTLQEYTWTISALFDNIQMQTISCAEKLKDIHFITFNISTIYVSMERKEILTIVDAVNDDSLDEYYDKVYNLCKPLCPECVFMISEEKDVDFSIMPKFDKIIEV